MGHGSKSYLKVKDKNIHRRLELIEPFTEIEWFYKKPKLFFIQACAVKENRKRFPSCEWPPFSRPFPKSGVLPALCILTPLILVPPDCHAPVACLQTINVFNQRALLIPRLVFLMWAT